jgi:hypothetical protein
MHVLRAGAPAISFLVFVLNFLSLAAVAPREDDFSVYVVVFANRTEVDIEKLQPSAGAAESSGLPSDEIAELVTWTANASENLDSNLQKRRRENRFLERVHATVSRIDFDGRPLKLVILDPEIDLVIDAAAAIGLCSTDARAGALVALGPSGVRLAAAAALVRLAIRSTLYAQMAPHESCSVDTPDLYLDEPAAAANVLDKWYAPVHVRRGLHGKREVMWIPVYKSLPVTHRASFYGASPEFRSVMNLMDQSTSRIEVCTCAGAESLRVLRRHEEQLFARHGSPIERAMAHLEELEEIARSARGQSGPEQMIRDALCHAHSIQESCECIGQNDPPSISAMPPYVTPQADSKPTADPVLDIYEQYPEPQVKTEEEYLRDNKVERGGPSTIDVIMAAVLDRAGKLLLGWKRLASLSIGHLGGGGETASETSEREDNETVAMWTGIVFATFSAGAALLCISICCRCCRTRPEMKRPRIR